MGAKRVVGAQPREGPWGGHLAGGGSWDAGTQPAAGVGTRCSASGGGAPALLPHGSPGTGRGGRSRGVPGCRRVSQPGPPIARWDIQRIREQRILQRLQLRMYKRKGIPESEPEVTSFFPEPDDGEGWAGGAAGGAACGGGCGQSGCVTPWFSRQWRVCSSPPTCPSSPSAAPYPNWPRSEYRGPPSRGGGRALRGARCGAETGSAHRNFELPWLDERSRCRLEVQKKQTPHRTCRK